MTRRESLGKGRVHSMVIVIKLMSIVCVCMFCCVKKRVWSRIPDPRKAIGPCFGLRIEMIESADVSKKHADAICTPIRQSK
jgi:hypothetical protein